MAHGSRPKTARLKRKRRIRKKIFGTLECPRLSVYRSNRFFYAQAIDDTSGKVLVAASSRDKGFDSPKDAGNKTGASKIGKLIAQLLQGKDISAVVFDRSGYRYHGCVKAIADAAREEGIKF